MSTTQTIESMEHQISVLSRKLCEIEDNWDDDAGWGEVGDDPGYNVMWWEREDLLEKLQEVKP